MPGSDSLARVSVVVPTYNQSKLLQVTIESVLDQTYPNLEIIVVDDGSTDDTATVLAQYSARVTCMRQANRGVAAARNAGIRVATGEYLTFMDHDDLMLPTKLERQVQVLDSRPEVGLVHCSYYHIDENGDHLDIVWGLPEGDTLRDLVCGDFVWVGGPLVRRQCLDHVGLFDEEHPWTADWDMWLRIAQAGYEFACVQEPLGAYRILKGSMMSDPAKLERDVFAVLDKVFSDSRLRDDVAAMKKIAYGTMRRWMSCRYYAAGCWEEAQRNLADALALRPEWLQSPQEFLQDLYGYALSPYVGNPVKFITDVFDHLPSCADGLHSYRSEAIGQIHAGLALRSYGLGNIAVAKAQLIEAIALDPAVLDQTDRFAEALRHNAMCLPVEVPLRYVDLVLQNLPAEAERLKRVRARVLSDVNIASAFQDHFAGRRRQVVRRVLRALRHRPSWLGNRGVVSILARSLLGLMIGERGEEKSGHA